MADDEIANGGTMNASQQYPNDFQLDNGPYYNQTDRSPSLSNLVEDLGLQADTDFPTPPNAYAADVESEVATPTKAKRAPTKRAKASKNKPVEDSEQESTDHEGEREAENEGDYEDDGDDDFEPEPAVVAKKTRTPKSAGKRKSTSTKTPKSKGKAPAKTPKSQKSTGKTKEALPPNRQRRVSLMCGSR